CWLGLQKLCPLFPAACVHLRSRLSFPTRRSSDLFLHQPRAEATAAEHLVAEEQRGVVRMASGDAELGDLQVGLVGRKLHVAMNRDRKSTRLNSSHVKSSYAVFCWKKKHHTTARLA